MQQIAQGSEQALARLYDLYSRQVYSLILTILQRPPEAEEVLQQVFLQVWRDASRYDAGRGSVYRWLVTLARSRAIDSTRARNFAARQQKETSLALLERHAVSPAASQLDAVLLLERAEVVRTALARIPDEQRQAMQLAYFSGYTQTEIAEKLGVPLGTVKSRMRQGLITLHALLAQELKP